MIPPALPLILWPLLTVWMVLRLGWARGVILSILAGYLLLPKGIGLNLPVLPTFQKDTIPALTLLGLGLMMGTDRSAPGGRGPALPVVDGLQTMLPGWLPRSGLGLGLLGLLMAGGFLTVLTNGDRLTYGPTSINGMRLYDAFALTLNMIMMVLPLLLGRRYLSHPDQHRLFLVIFVAALLIYTLPTLFEARMSPQLNVHLYGYRQASWHMVSRGGGWRPVVFLDHGLVLGLVFCMASLAAVGLIRLVAPARRVVAAGVALWLLMTLVLVNSLGALLIALALLPVVVVSGLRLQLLAAAAIAGAVLFYPMLRGADLVPTTAIVNLARSIDDNRARSLEFRLRNEDQLLDHANRRALFGWGPYNRNRVYDEEGRRVSVTDGTWIITIGQGGWVRYIGLFGLLTLPIILLSVRRRQIEPSRETALLSVVLVANLVDLIPNSGQTPITWLMAGALLGRVELGRLGAPSETAQARIPARPGYARDADAPDIPAPPPPDPAPGGPVYTRHPVRQVRRLRNSER